jgi:hypothetical protein
MEKSHQRNANLRKAAREDRREAAVETYSKRQLSLPKRRKPLKSSRQRKRRKSSRSAARSLNSRKRAARRRLPLAARKRQKMSPVWPRK